MAASFLIIKLNLLAQDIFVDDSVQIEEVTIAADRSYRNLQAGTNIIRLDTLILNNKLSGNLSDVLTQNTTVFIKSYGGGSVATASIRGTGASHTALIWNGMPINSPMTGQADFSLIPVYFIDEANVLMGAASLLNVGGALGGGVAVDNKPDWNSGFKTRLVQGYGSFNTYTGFGQIGWSGNKLAIRLRSFFESSDNDYKYYNNAKNVDEVGYYHQKNSQYQRHGILSEAYLKLTNNSVFSLKYWFYDKENHIPKLISSSAKDHNEVQNDKNQRIVASWQGNQQNWMYSFSTGYASDITSYLLKSNISGVNNDTANFNSINRTHILFNNLFAQLTTANQLKISIQVSDVYANCIANEQVKNNRFDARQNEFSVLIAAYKNLGERWLVSALLRQNVINNHIAKPIPSLGIEYDVIAQSRLKLKANLSRNYHHPSLNDKYYLPGGNSNLKPEEGNTGEFGLVSFLGHFKLSETAFYSVINNWILWEPTQFGYWEPKNIQTVHSRGVESLLEYKKHWQNWSVAMNLKYTYTITTNQSNNLGEFDERKGKQLIYLPLHSASMVFNIDYKSFNANWVTYYAGMRYTDTSNDPNAKPLEAYQVNNFSFGKQFSFRNTSLNTYLKIENIFDTNYNSVVHRPMPGRSFSVLLKYTF